MINRDKICDENKEIISEYKSLAKKYNLPKFEFLVNEFDILKSDINKETILRDIRKAMVIKLSSIMQFIELLLNPSNGSMFNMLLVKGVNGDERETLNELFSLIGEIEIDSFSLDINYDSVKEAEFIKDNCKKWDEMKIKLEKIVCSLKNNWKKASNKKQRSYFG